MQYKFPSETWNRENMKLESGIFSQKLGIQSIN